MTKKKSVKLPAKIGGEGRVDLLPPTAGCLMLVDADIACYQATMDPKAFREEHHDTAWGREVSYHLNVDVAESQVEEKLEEWKETLRADGMILCWGGAGNWRKRVHPEYKANRSARKPLGYGVLRERMMQNRMSIAWLQMEADDVMGVLGTSDSNTVIVSEDKDMLGVPARVWNPRTEQYLEVSQADADAWHLTQTLVGDATDNYKGCPGVGIKSAKALLDPHYGDPMASWQTVVAAYVKAGLDVDEALKNARVARIVRAGDYDPETGELSLWNPPTRKRATRRGARKDKQ